jgi:hypothetical protein
MLEISEDTQILITIVEIAIITLIAGMIVRGELPVI